MGDRRMLTKKVTDDDNFMALSSSAQALYLHLSMSADDDGFCNQVTLSMFKAHASVQDLQALLEKRYIYQFENGVIVIKHWRMANALRKDRYTPTVFKQELEMLNLNSEGIYSLGAEDARLPVGCQVVAERLPVGCPNISKDKLSKDKLSKDKVTIVTANAEGFDEFWEAYPRKTSKAEARKAWNKLKPNEELREKMLASIEAWKGTDQWREPRYIPHPSTWLNQERWNDEAPEDPYERLRRQIEQMEKGGQA